VRSDQSLDKISYLSPDNQAPQIVGDSLPKEPSPIIVTDQRGRSKWTISIPPTLGFPLKPVHYVNICEQSTAMSQQVAMSKKPQSDQKHAHAAHHGYYYDDSHFMDIADAESHNILSGVEESSSNESPVQKCDRSLTYVLETSSAGLGQTILSLWLAFGLAQLEKRAFFIDDTNWPYGSYNTYFKPPPTPGCLPPPKTQIVPCPHQAKHLLVSAATTKHTLGHMFMEHFEDGKKMGVMRQHKIFGMMRAGYEALFQGKLNDDDQAYLNDRTAELNGMIRNEGGEEIGLHVRHGDRHPLEYQYQKSYIPLEKYLKTAQNLTTQAATPASSRILIASDDPDIYTDPLITTSTTTTHSQVEKAQSRISLASKNSLSASGKTGLGWEGGFFKDIFWALGVPPEEQIPRVPNSAQPSRRRNVEVVSDSLASSSANMMRDVESKEESAALPDPHKHPSPSALNLRQLIGRAYLLDLAVLGQSDTVVCAVSSLGCRILAVMMGWDRAIVGGGWVNVDGKFDWRGIDW
jgi:hypothetical protein